MKSRPTPDGSGVLFHSALSSGPLSARGRRAKPKQDEDGEKVDLTWRNKHTPEEKNIFLRYIQGT